MPEVDNLSLVLHAVKDLRLEMRPTPQPERNQVQISMRKVGICGSDVHFYQHGAIGDCVVKSPMVMGHEGSGLVTAVGEDVTNLKVGDRVAIEPGVPCKCCEFCKSGRYNLCPDVKFCATPPIDGSMARTYCHAADFCFKIPDSMTWEEAALCEPVSCAVAACRRADVSSGKTVLIFGAGPIGLLCAMVARAHGAAQVGICDVGFFRVDFAKRALPSDVRTFFTDRSTASEQSAHTIVKMAMDGRAPDICIECSGAESAQQTAVLAVKTGGCVALVGLGHPTASIPIINVVCREVDIRGIFRYCNCYPSAISLIANKLIDPAKIVSHTLPIEQGVQAYELTADRSSGAIKVMVDCERKS